MRKQSWTIALCALLAALGTALMTAGGLIPIATYCSPLLAGILLLPVLEEFGTREARMVWAGRPAPSLMLRPEMGAGAMYPFLRWYRSRKPAFDRIRPRALSFLAKLLTFLLALSLMYALLCFVFQLDAVLEDFRTLGIALNLAFDLLLVFVMLIYDFLLGRLRLLYVYRLRPRLLRLSGRE